jgi:hypothetical protein
MKSTNQKKGDSMFDYFQVQLTFFFYPIRKESPQASHQSIALENSKKNEQKVYYKHVLRKVCF